MKKFFLDAKCLGTEFFLTGIRPWYTYNDGVKGDQCGYAYEVCVPANNLERMTVKVPGEQRVDAPETGYLRVTFENLLVSPYVTSEGRLGLSATADGISLMAEKPTK